MPMLSYLVVIADSTRDEKDEDYAAYATQWEACAVADAINRAGVRYCITAEVWVTQAGGTRKRL
jgi:hypothetical protein